MIATWFEHLRKGSHFFISINYLSKTPRLPMLLFFLFLSKSFLSFVISWRTKIISVKTIQLAILGNRKQITKRSRVHRYVGTRGTISVVMFKIPPLNIQHATEEIFDYSVPTVENRGGSRGRVQGVRTPPPPPRDDLRFFNTTGILQKKNYVIYWC